MTTKGWFYQYNCELSEALIILAIAHEGIGTVANNGAAVMVETHAGCVYVLPAGVL